MSEPTHLSFELEYYPLKKGMFKEPRFPVIAYSEMEEHRTVVTPAKLMPDYEGRHCACVGKIHLESSGRNISVSFGDAKGKVTTGDGIVCICRFGSKEEFSKKDLTKAETSEALNYLEPNMDM